MNTLRYPVLGLAAMLAGLAPALVAPAVGAAVAPSGIYAEWTVQSTIGLTSGSPDMWSLACPGADGTDCVAVGETFGARVNGQPSYSPLAMTGGPGAWTLESPPDPASQSVLTGVSCTSTNACVAVGEEGNNTSGFAEDWNGTSWSLLSNPPATQALFGDSCTLVRTRFLTYSSCTAVGWDNLSAVARRYALGAWVSEPVPSPAGATRTMLQSVSCVNDDTCTAVGESWNSAGAETPLVERLSGTSWSVQPSPAPAGYLNAVSCASSTTCMAAGGTSAGALTELWNGSTWAVEPTPNGSGVLFGVDCWSTAVCTAVGSSSLALGWVTSSWGVYGMPLASGSTYSVPQAVSCWSSDYCLSVGPGNFAGGVSKIVVEHSLPVT